MNKHRYPRRPRKDAKFWAVVDRVLAAVETAYPVEVRIDRRAAVKSGGNWGWNWRDAIKRKLFRIVLKHPQTGVDIADRAILIDGFIHELAHVMHYQPHHELLDDPKIHDEAWGVYYSKAYRLAYETE